jgi:hypothetical protein
MNGSKKDGGHSSALLAATKSDRGTTPRNEVDNESDHGADQQDMNEKPCYMKRKETTGPEQ